MAVKSAIEFVEIEGALEQLHSVIRYLVLEDNQLMSSRGLSEEYLFKDCFPL